MNRSEIPQSWCILLQEACPQGKLVNQGLTYWSFIGAVVGEEDTQPQPPLAVLSQLPRGGISEGHGEKQAHDQAET